MAVRDVPLLALLAPGALGAAGIVGIVYAYVHLLVGRPAGAALATLAAARRTVATHLLRATVVVLGLLSLVVLVVFEQTVLSVVPVYVGLVLAVNSLGYGTVVHTLPALEVYIDNVAPVFGYLDGRGIDIGALGVVEEARLEEAAAHDNVVGLVLDVVGAEIVSIDANVVCSELYPAAAIGVAGDVEAHLARLATRLTVEVGTVSRGQGAVGRVGDIS